MTDDGGLHKVVFTFSVSTLVTRERSDPTLLVVVTLEIGRREGTEDCEGFTFCLDEKESGERSETLRITVNRRKRKVLGFPIFHISTWTLSLSCLPWKISEHLLTGRRGDRVTN